MAVAYESSARASSDAGCGILVHRIRWTQAASGVAGRANVMLSGVTSHRQPRQCRGQEPKTVKGAKSDPNYVSRLLTRSECLPRGGAKNYSYATG